MLGPEQGGELGKKRKENEGEREITSRWEKQTRGKQKDPGGPEILGSTSKKKHIRKKRSH